MHVEGGSGAGWCSSASTSNGWALSCSAQEEQAQQLEQQQEHREKSRPAAGIPGRNREAAPLRPDHTHTVLAVRRLCSKIRFGSCVHLLIPMSV